MLLLHPPPDPPLKHGPAPDGAHAKRRHLRATTAAGANSASLRSWRTRCGAACAVACSMHWRMRRPTTCTTGGGWQGAGYNTNGGRLLQRKQTHNESVTGEHRGRGIGEDCIGKGGCKGLQKRFHRAQRGQHSVAIWARKEVCAKAEAGIPSTVLNAKTTRRCGGHKERCDRRPAAAAGS